MSSPTSLTIADLRARSVQELAGLHDGGTCPSTRELFGAMDGEVLGMKLPRQLQPWRGKVITGSSAQTADGLNRLGLGPFELRRFRFEAVRGASRFADRDVLILDHTRKSNPAWVRRFHDELVRIDDGLYLATTHYQALGRLQHLGYFALATGPATPKYPTT